MWNWTLTIGSTLVRFMFLELLFTSMVQGMPIDAEGNMVLHLGDTSISFSVVGGGCLTLLCYFTWIELYCTSKTRSDRVTVPEIMLKSAFYGVLYFGFAGVLPRYLYFKTDFFEKHFASTAALLIVIVSFTAFDGEYLVFKGKEMVAFLLLVG